MTVIYILVVISNTFKLMKIVPLASQSSCNKLELCKQEKVELWQLPFPLERPDEGLRVKMAMVLYNKSCRLQYNSTKHENA